MKLFSMDENKENIAEQLLNERLITRKQFAEIKAYRLVGIFSLHNELQFLLYLSVSLFTTGAGIFIYKNIDTIGHSIILLILLALTAACFYFCFKKAKEFSKGETNFDNPVFNYIVLTATILSCIFIGYFQIQYEPFGNNYELATLIAALIALTSAYYFDNRSALSVGITGLAATVGITITPKALLENNFFDNPSLFYYGVALGILLIVWAEYSEKIALKKHFTVFHLTFSLHLIGICCITGLFQEYWFLYAFFLLASGIYFFKKSYRMRAISVFVFVLIYGFIGFNILLFRFLEFAHIENYELLSILAPVYFIGSIILFIRTIKQFNKNDDSIR